LHLLFGQRIYFFYHRHVHDLSSCLGHHLDLLL
jgi:hypothetical protein